ncbi:MAG: TolB family protein [Pyrinomonadaceae bacterium]
MWWPRAAAWAAMLLLTAALAASGCRQVKNAAGLSVRPKSLRDVPAERLSFRFEADAKEESLPERLRHDEPEEPLPGVKTAFETQRTTDALIRTVSDTVNQRALALYGTSETSENNTDFRIDLYSAEGQFLRNILPHDLTGVFPAQVAWSPDSQNFAFSGVRNPSLTPTPTPDAAPPPPPPGTQPQPLAPSMPEAAPTAVGPSIPSVQTFRTEQVYVANRDGFELRPLTSREGLIYFKLTWSPDGRQIAALACKEDEYNARMSEGLLPAGRPRVITLEGQERLLDDRLTEVAPVWSPDGSKVATAFGYDVAVYDAATEHPTGGGISLQEPLRAASVEYDARVFKKSSPQSNTQPNTQQQNAGASAGAAVLISLNPFVRLEWEEPETIYAQTAFVRFYRNDPLPTFKYTRWHVLRLSPQAAVLGLFQPPRLSN